MNELFAMFWCLMIFMSIFWYAFLLFYVGFKGAKEIKVMIRALGARPDIDNRPQSKG